MDVRRGGHHHHRHGCQLKILSFSGIFCRIGGDGQRAEPGHRGQPRRHERVGGEALRPATDHAGQGRADGLAQGKEEGGVGEGPGDQLETMLFSAANAAAMPMTGLPWPNACLAPTFVFTKKPAWINFFGICNRSVISAGYSWYQSSYHCFDSFKYERICDVKPRTHQ